jgi:hypothetical protein
MDQIPCPDGYLLDPNSILADGHHILNDYLARVEEAGWRTGLKEINAIRDKARKLTAWKALLERLQWLQQNNPSSFAVSSFRGLAERLEKWKLSPSEADLLEILDRTADLASFVAPYTPMPHLMTYLQEKGLTPRLAAGIRDFREHVWKQNYQVNQVSLQMFRSRLDMLAWRDEWTAVDLGRCWSEQIRADFRRMQGKEKETWRQLLYSIHGDEGTRPTAAWLAESRTRVEAIGPEKFVDSVRRWFSPLRPMSTQRLSREGSYLLRSFIWLADDSKFPELLTKIGEICEVKFKPESNGQKVIRAAAEAVGKPDPMAKRSVLPPSLDSLIMRALTTVLSPGSSLVSGELAARIQINGDVVHVRGDLDSYRVHVSTGAIFRDSDGQRVNVADSDLRFGSIDVPEFGGVTELLRHILSLIQDSKHPTALSSYSEEV